MKYVVVSGGVVSGIGKGIVASSLGVILRCMGFRVTAIKIDPYLNVDAGTMSPYEHGEVFVLDDGGEADLDLGNYERFMDLRLTREHNLTTGKIYQRVIEQERAGRYLGRTVQVVPHVTNEIQDWIERVAEIAVDGQDEGGAPDVCVIELGGTVGDIESMPFVEALRQLQFRESVGRSGLLNVHVSLVPVVGAVGEQKTKPTQASVRQVRALGLNPDVLVCRSSSPLQPDVLHKLSEMCGVPVGSIMALHDVPNLYHVPLELMAQGVHRAMARVFGWPLAESPSARGKHEYLDPVRSPLHVSWRGFSAKLDEIAQKPADSAVRIALVGKYTGLMDAYLSVTKALMHSSLELGERIAMDWIDAELLEEDEAHCSAEGQKAWQTLRTADGVLVLGGFGPRGTEGKVCATQYARESRVPFLGICLGMQIAVIELARHGAGLTQANSTEFDENTPHPVVLFMPEIDKSRMGGTMRLGIRETRFRSGAAGEGLLRAMYGGSTTVLERHRHRYEVNPDYWARLEAAGARFVGLAEDGRRAVMMELPVDTHPFFVGVQFHPEFTSRPGNPSPPFLAFARASLLHRKEKKHIA